ncbi:MAG: polysaccharide pyruvyl transferase family protein, partial [Aureliella sp.]
IVGRFEEQTSKGFMWRDIGLGEWLFDFDQASDTARYPAAVVKMLTDRERSREMVRQAQKVVAARQQASLAILAKSLP